MSSAFNKVMNILDLVNYIQYYTDLRQLFSASKQLSHWRRELQYWKLNTDASKQYHSKWEFRHAIEKLVSDTSKQISLNLRCCANLTDVSALGNVHTLNLRYCSKITDLSALQNVKKLILTERHNINNIRALDNVHIFY